MNLSVYRWNLRPEEGLSLELRIVASNASVARREVHRFLVEHDGAAWTVESVSREATRVPRALRGAFDESSIPPRIRSGRH